MKDKRSLFKSKRQAQAHVTPSFFISVYCITKLTNSDLLNTMIDGK